MLCLGVSCYIMKKYKKLSEKLTEAGSNISNLDIASGISRMSRLSGIKSNMLRTRPSGVASKTGSNILPSNKPTNIKFIKNRTDSSFDSPDRQKSYGFKVKH